MEKNSNKFTMEPDIHKHYQYNAWEPGREGLHPASQAFLLDPTSRRNTNVRFPDLNELEVKPVLNFSLQTGEEFALEFMRDRVHHKKTFIPNALGDPIHAPGHMELKGILDTSRAGSESGSGVSILPLAEKGQKDNERANLSLHVERSNYGSAHSLPQTSSEYGSRALLHGFTPSVASDSSSTKLKVLCSFGGTILPRPSDGKLRYVEGETHIICISRDISWEELKQKTLAIYYQLHVIKYQLPGEDLDALVSVSCDEDLRNMMEEWNEVGDREGSQKLRMFLFSMSDLEDSQFGLGSLEGGSEIQYVVAVNGMDIGSRKNSIVHGLASSSGNNLSELDRLIIDREASRIATVSAGVGTSTLTSTFQPVQSILQNSSSANEMHPQFCHGQMMDHKEAQQFLSYYPHNSSNHSPSEEIPHSASAQGFMHERDSNGEKSWDSFLGQNSQTLVKKAKWKPDGSVQHEDGIEKPCPQEKAVPVNEISVAAQGDLRSLPSKNEDKREESENASSSVYENNQVQVSKSFEDDQCSTSSSVFGLGGADSVSHLIDLSYLEPSVPPQRVYFSERIPREQEEMMNRLSKSDDLHGSQFLISHSEQKQITKSAENFNQSNMDLRSEHPMPTAEPFHLQNYKEFVDAVSQMNNTLSDSQDVSQNGLKLSVPNNVDDKDSSNKDAMLQAEHDHTVGNQKKILIEETSESRSGNPAASNSLMHLKHPVTDLPGPKVREITVKDFDTKNLGHSLLFSLTESWTNDISQGIPCIGVSATKQADISVDINDRFPRDFLCEIYSRGILVEDRTGASPMHKDGAGMSVVMENHEPKHWSYFQKLALEEFVQKDVSLIDQELLDGDEKSYCFAPLTADGVSIDHKYSQFNFVEDINEKNLPGGADFTVHSDFDHSQAKGREIMQFGAMMGNLKSPESQYEGGNLEKWNIGLPPIDPSLLDFNLNTLQVFLLYI
uniref:PB1 domain-containing protein n=1 Tax=Manihot esculenta TaxID=3983 RepID=A0A2C9UHQ3_MANES